MLLSLSIKNYALIESLETDFSNQFSVITGETGAGKSILLGALGLVLGNRADLTSLKLTELLINLGIKMLDDIISSVLENKIKNVILPPYQSKN